MENEKKSNGTLVGLLIGLVIAIIIGVALFATGTISFKTNTTESNEQTTEDDQTNTTDNTSSTNNIILTNLVDNLSCDNSETTFNNITVKVEQKMEDMVCTAENITINGNKINEFPGFYLKSYEMYNDNVILLFGSTSAKTFAIYNTTSNKIVVKLTSNELEGYLIESYSTNDEIITISGKECGEQCGNKKTEYSKAIFEIEYANNSFSSPKLVEKLA